MDSDHVLDRPCEPPDAVLRYADHADGLVDVYLPPGPTLPRPLLLHVHGGFWRQAYDRTHARPFAQAMARAGWVVALPEYRRGPDAWTRTSTDLEAVAAAIPGLLGDIAIPTTTTTVSGHSAGGHLALWLANQEHPLHRVVALAPVGDLRWAAKAAIGSRAAVDFLGGTPKARPEVYAAADPASRMTRRPAAEVVVVHGDRDDAVPVRSSRSLAERHAWLDYRELAGIDHFDLIDPLSAAWPAVLEAITAEPSRSG